MSIAVIYASESTLRARGPHCFISPVDGRRPKTNWEVACGSKGIAATCRLHAGKFFRAVFCREPQKDQIMSIYQVWDGCQSQNMECTENESDIQIYCCLPLLENRTRTALIATSLSCHRHFANPIGTCLSKLFPKNSLKRTEKVRSIRATA